MRRARERPQNDFCGAERQAQVGPVKGFKFASQKFWTSRSFLTAVSVTQT
jgi:hypothetical protein